MTIEPAVRDLAKGPNFAVLTTQMPDGAAQSQVMWVDCDDEHVLINTEIGRQKERNVTRDPRATVTIIDKDNPYRFAEVRGEVVEQVRGPEARAHIDALAVKYTGQPYKQEAIQTERVLLKIRPHRQLAR